MELTLAIWAMFAAVLLICTWKVAKVVWLRPWRLERTLRQQGIAGTPYRLGIGDLWEMGRMKREAEASASSSAQSSQDIVPFILPFHQQSVQRYGKCSYIWMGPNPVVIVADGELLKEIFSRVYDFGKPHIEGVGDLLASGLVFYEGEKWTKHRKILNPAFHLERLKPVLAASSVSCDRMMSKWETLLSLDGSCEVDVLPYVDNLTADVISRAAFGSSYEEGQRIFLLQKEQIDLTFKVLPLSYIPGWRFFPTRMDRRMKKIDGEVKAALRGLVDKKVKAMEEGQAVSDDLLGILLESNLQEIEGSGNEKGMSIDEVISECKVFYLAGQETTASMLVWALILLSEHQDWQAKARAEIMEVFGDKEPDFAGLSRLKTVNMILHEVLRLYPPGAAMYRKSYRATSLGPYHLPADLTLFVPILLIHHDKQIWGEDAQVFNPERFSEGVSKASTGQSPLPFLPFSAGPRVCIGQNFALIEAKATLAKILRWFTMELSPSYRHAPASLLTIRPQFGAPLILRKL